MDRKQRKFESVDGFIELTVQSGGTIRVGKFKVVTRYYDDTRALQAAFTGIETDDKRQAKKFFWETVSQVAERFEKDSIGEIVGVIMLLYPGVQLRRVEFEEK